MDSQRRRRRTVAAAAVSALALAATIFVVAIPPAHETTVSTPLRARTAAGLKMRTNFFAAPQANMRCHRVRLIAPCAEEKKGPEFGPAKIADIQPACEGGVYRVCVDAPQTASQYAKAGQFAQMRVGESKPGFFAMSNRPGSEKLEFLIKSVDGTAGLINSMKVGDQLEITDVMGKGFPWDGVSDNEKFNGGTYVFATGTGFGPIKAMIQSGSFKGRKNLKIYYGVKDEEHMPFREQFDGWLSDGLFGDVDEVPIVPVYSCAATSDDAKYVQDVAVVDLDGMDPSTASAIICGHFDMTNKLKEKLIGEVGIPAENVLTNF